VQITSRAPIDARLINVELPDMFGFELHETLRQRYPKTRFALAGGAPLSDNELQTRTRGAARYLCKPPQSWRLEHFNEKSKNGEPILKRPVKLRFNPTVIPRWRSLS
jgi:response regulator RpfG family c-di-GMP phosphodiesterase